MSEKWEPMKVKLGAIVPIIRESLIKGIKLLLVGNPGIGKTAIINDVIATLPPYIDGGKPALHLNWFLAQEQEENVDGIPFKVEDDHGAYAEHLLFAKQRQNVLIDDRLVINFLDDLTMGGTRKQQSNMQFFDGSILGERLGDNIRFIGATNDVKMKAGSSPLIEPFKSRCTCIYHGIADHPFWEKWAIESGLVHPHIIAYLNSNPHCLDMFVPSVNLTNSPSPRTWCHASDMMYLCERVDADEYVTRASVEGAIGAPETVQLFNYKKMLDTAVTPQIILADPNGANVPENASIMYAVSLALCHTVDNVETAEYAMQYARRLPAEFEALIVRQLIKKVPDSLVTSEYIDYTARQSKMVL